MMGVHLHGRRWRLAAAIMLSFLASGAGVGLMGISAWLISRAAEHPPVLYLLVAVVTVRALGISRGVFRYLERLVGHDVALRQLAELRMVTYLKLTSTTTLGRRAGDVLARVTADVESVVDLVVRVLVPFASAGIVVAATTAAIASVSPWSGLVLLVSALIAGALLPWLARLLSRHADGSIAPHRGELAALITESAGAGVDLLAYGAEVSMMQRLRAVDTRLRRAEAHAAMVGGLAAAGQVIAAGGAVVGSLLIGAQAVSAGTLQPVYLAVLVLTPLALHEVLSTLPAAAQAWTRTKVALGRVTEILAAPQVGTGDREITPTAEPGYLRAEHLAVGWPDSPVLFSDFDLSVSAGERVALVGESGIGKTTIAATLLGLIPARGGEVEIRGRVGYLAQDAYLFDTSVAENVRIGRRDAADDEVQAALRLVRLDLDLGRLVGEHGSSLSGGEARRLALARLVVGHYDVVILDEPTEHLDRQTADALMTDIWSLLAGTAVIIITHDQTVADRCDRILTLPPSRLTEERPTAAAPRTPRASRHQPGYARS